MFETLEIAWITPREASVVLGLVLGVIFGALAQRTGFCFRRAIAGDPGDRLPALALWLVALAAAVAGTQLAVLSGLVGFQTHRFAAPAVPVVPIALGGMLFGVGMVLARGCASRMTVLAATGNLRALVTLIVIAAVGMASMRGVLAPLREAAFTLGPLVPGGVLPGPGLGWALALAALAWLVAWRTGLGLWRTVAGVALGLLVPAGWVGTGFVLFDAFDPIAVESLSFTAPTGEALFWSLAASGIAPGFGVGLVGGTLAGSLGAALTGRSFRWQAFDGGPRATARYLAGGALMGFGGVMAGGCTVGAGLSGVATLGLAAVLALAGIVAGAGGAAVFFSRSARGSGGPETTPPAPPPA